MELHKIFSFPFSSAPHPITGSHGSVRPTPLPRLTLSLFLYLAHHLTPEFRSRSFHLSPCLETLPLHILLQHNKALKTQGLKATTTIYRLTVPQRGRVRWQRLVSALCVMAAATWPGLQASSPRYWHVRWFCWFAAPHGASWASLSSALANPRGPLSTWPLSPAGQANWTFVLGSSGFQKCRYGNCGVS